MQEAGYVPRRTRVAQHRGIYYRENASGERRYEITYMDSNGKRRWQVVPGQLRDALNALADIQQRQRKGERVAPTKIKFGEFADAWLEAQTNLRDNTRRTYKWALESHIKPAIGERRISTITTDDVTDLIARLQADGIKPWSVRGVLTPLSRVLGSAARKGVIASNPVSRLERGERPSVQRKEMRILNRDEIGRLLAAADAELYRPMFATAIFSGLRIGELLGLTWQDVDFEANVLRVRKQMDRFSRERRDLKTPTAVRDVILMPAVGRLLREHRMASPHSRDGDLVFCEPTGRGIDRNGVNQYALAKAVKQAGLDEPGRPNITPHQLRHCFASLLIAQGLNVTFVSRQLGHASPAITLNVYARLFDEVEHAAKATAQLEASFGALLSMGDPTWPGGVVSLGAGGG